MNEQKPKSGRGCLFYGGIAAGVLFLIVLLAVFSAVRMAKKFVNEYTDSAPLSLPTVQVSEEQVKRARERITQFRDAVQNNRSVEPLIITADEANALIASDPELKGLQGNFFLTFEEGQVKAQLSVPIERISGISMLRGRYLNGTGIFSVSLRDGTLWVSPESISTTQGKAIPEDVMKNLRRENFAAGYTNNPNFNAAVAKLEEIQIKEGKLIIVPKKPEK